MGAPEKSCRTCGWYKREHVGGPRTYGHCRQAAPFKPTHANTRGCKQWQDRATVERPAAEQPCATCLHAERCRFLLGFSFRQAGPCDWTPTRWTPAPNFAKEG